MLLEDGGDAIVLFELVVITWGSFSSVPGVSMLFGASSVGLIVGALVSVSAVLFSIARDGFDVFCDNDGCLEQAVTKKIKANKKVCINFMRA